MLVDLEMTDAGWVRIRPVDAAGGSLTSARILVPPRGQWRGWRFRRLRKLAPGRVDLRIPVDTGRAIGEDTGNGNPQAVSSQPGTLDHANIPDLFRPRKMR